MEYHSGGSLPLLGRPRYCPGANANGGYLCETGHCCGETGCCTYYYELWWFWLLWTVLILFSCCCAYRHRRAKLRVQQQQRQREISLLAYHGANSFPSSMLDLSFLASLKLPSYEEVAAQPSTPPPPYSSVFTTPRYPQPPRAADPHLLTQHGPLLHRPLSDGPSSLSSDNSSSCSCDSCCPSSPCSSSLSAPVTYETDTSHASTPSEVTPLTLDVTMETITAVASCLEGSQARFAAAMPVDVGDPGAAGAQEPLAKDSSPPCQTVTVAVVTRAASLQSLPSPGPELTLPVGTTSPIMQQLEIGPCSPVASTGSSALPSPSVDAALPSIRVMKIESISGSLAAIGLSRTFDPAISSHSPTSVPSLDVGRTLSLPTTPDQNLSLVPTSAPATLTRVQNHLPPDPATAPGPVLNPQPQSPVVPDPISHGPPPASPLTQSQNPDLSPGSGLLQTSSGPGTSLSQLGMSCKDLSAAPEPESTESDLVPPLPLEVQARSSNVSGSGSGSSLSCPVIAVESETSSVVSPSPRSPSSLPAPALLLDPLTALHQSDRGGSSSGHASSLSPSPRATQSPPKQTVFSPCVDVFEARSPNWENEDDREDTEGRRDEEDEEDEDDDMGADESQYRHRRLTGDSGIEVCRCRVEEEDDEEEGEEEEEEEEQRERKEDSKRGGGGNANVHDSVDCPARGQMSTGDGLTLCTPTANATTPTPDDAGKVVIVMETV